MTIDEKIRNEKMKYNINREGAKIWALSSVKINKYEYLTDEEILSSDQIQIIEQGKLIHFPLAKTLEKQTKTYEDQGKKKLRLCKS